MTARTPRFAALAAAALFTLAGSALAAEPQTMKAVRYHAYGDASVLKYEDAPRPVAGAGEVLVRIQAAGVNPIDWKLRAGTFRNDPKLLPVISGYDIAGVVEAVGPDVTAFKAGDAVFGFAGDKGGAYAEYAAVKVGNLVRTPSNIDAVQAAAIPTAAVTAYRALVQQGELQPGQTVLIHAAAGGVGSYAVQIAKQRGAKVIGTASAENHAFLKSLGADVTIDYRTQKFEDVVKDVDLVLVAVGGDTVERSYGVVKKGGTIVSIASRVDPAKLEAHGLRKPTAGGAPSPLPEVAALVAAGKLKSEVSATYPLADARKAQEQSETGHARGKIVLTVGAGK